MRSPSRSQKVLRWAAASRASEPAWLRTSSRPRLAARVAASPPRGARGPALPLGAELLDPSGHLLLPAALLAAGRRLRPDHEQVGQRLPARDDRPALGEAGESPVEAGGVTRELNGRGVGQVAAAPPEQRHRRAGEEEQEAGGHLGEQEERQKGRTRDDQEAADGAEVVAAEPLRRLVAARLHEGAVPGEEPDQHPRSLRARVAAPARSERESEPGPRDPARESGERGQHHHDHQLQDVEERVDLRRAPQVAVSDRADQVGQQALGRVAIELVEHSAPHDHVALRGIPARGRGVGDRAVEEAHPGRRDARRRSPSPRPR